MFCFDIDNKQIYFNMFMRNNNHFSSTYLNISAYCIRALNVCISGSLYRWLSWLINFWKKNIRMCAKLSGCLMCFLCYIPSRRPSQSNKVMLPRDGYLTINRHAMLWRCHLVTDFVMPPFRMSWADISSQECGWRWFHVCKLRPCLCMNSGSPFAKR